MVLELIPKRSKNKFENHPTNNSEKHRIYHPKNENFQMLAPFLEPAALVFRGWCVVFASCFSTPLGGYPLGPMLASPAAPLVRFSWLFGRCQEQVSSKNQRFQSNKWYQPHLTKNEQGLKITLPIIYLKRNNLLLCCFTKPRKSIAPGLF